jgi:hypothetical protein
VDENAVRQEAETHAAATVKGDLRTAGSSLTKDAMGDAGTVMKSMPGELDSHEVTGVQASGEEYVATIAYSGEGKTVTVESRWAEVDGNPRIVGLKVV